jgi:hypothetical protein
MGWNSCAGAQKETGNWRVEIAGRSRSPCRNRARRESVYYAAVSGRRVKPRTERLALRSSGQPGEIGIAARSVLAARLSPDDNDFKHLHAAQLLVGQPVTATNASTSKRVPVRPFSVAGVN